MTSYESEPEREFFLTGARTYLDAQDALTEFCRQVIERSTALVRKRLPNIIDACGSGFFGEPTDYTFFDEESGSQRLGTKLEAKGRRCRLCFSLELRRDKDTVAYRALVHLWRGKVGIADNLWSRRKAPLQNSKKLYFPSCLDESQIPDFNEHLDEAITDFTKFIKKAGGLEKHFPRKP